MPKHLGIAEALREAIAEEMERDPRVFCLGEDIAVPGGWGGAFTVTLGLEKRFPDRMINTPIAELGFFGVACGAAMMGMRPIVDVQYGDFLLLAIDQIINNIAKMRYMSGGQITVPLVMRAPVGATGRGSQHAQNVERYFTGVPGIKVRRGLQCLRRQGDSQGRRARRQPGDDLRAQAAVRLEGRPGRERRGRCHQRDSRRRLHGAAGHRGRLPRGKRRDDPRLAADAALRARRRPATRRRGDRRRGDRRAQPVAAGLRDDRRFGPEDGPRRDRRGGPARPARSARRSRPGSWNVLATTCAARSGAWPRPTCRCRSLRCWKTPIAPTCPASSRRPGRSCSSEREGSGRAGCDRGYDHDHATSTCSQVVLSHAARSAGGRLPFSQVLVGLFLAGSVPQGRRRGSGGARVGSKNPSRSRPSLAASVWLGPHRTAADRGGGMDSDPQPPPEYSVVAYLRGKEIGPHGADPDWPGTRDRPGLVRPLAHGVGAGGQAGAGRGGRIGTADRRAGPVRGGRDRSAGPRSSIRSISARFWCRPIGSSWPTASRERIDVAAICRTGDVPGARVTAWFESAPAAKTAAEMALVQDRPGRGSLPLPPAAANLDRDVLHVSIAPASGAELWHKTIPTMLVHRPPQWPEFGAAETKLRYDAPISVRADDGTFSSMSYDEAWDSKLQDVVVALPNGSRFRVLARVQLRAVLGGPPQHGPELRVGRDQPARGRLHRLRRAAHGQGTPLRPRADCGIDAGQGPRALELPVVRFQVQGLGRFGRRGLLLLSRRIRHAGAHAAERAQPATTS